MPVPMAGALVDWRSCPECADLDTRVDSAMAACRALLGPRAAALMAEAGAEFVVRSIGAGVSMFCQRFPYGQGGEPERPWAHAQREARDMVETARRTVEVRKEAAVPRPHPDGLCCRVCGAVYSLAPEQVRPDAEYEYEFVRQPTFRTGERWQSLVPFGYPVCGECAVIGHETNIAFGKGRRVVTGGDLKALLRESFAWDCWGREGFPRPFAEDTGWRPACEAPGWGQVQGAGLRWGYVPEAVRTTAEGLVAAYDGCLAPAEVRARNAASHMGIGLRGTYRSVEVEAARVRNLQTLLMSPEELRDHQLKAIGRHRESLRLWS